MSTIAAATTSFATDALVSLLRSGPSASADAAAPARGDDPAVVLDLSDRAKAVLERNKVERAVADRLDQQLAAADGDTSAPAPKSKSDDAKLFDTSSGPSGLASVTELRNARYAKWAPTLTASVTVHDGPSPYGVPEISDADLYESLKQTFVSMADHYDETGKFPPGTGQALRDAVAKGTVKIQDAADVPDLNMHSTHVYSPSSVGGPSTWGTSTINPTGAIKDAYEQGRGFSLWQEDRGNLWISW